MTERIPTTTTCAMIDLVQGGRVRVRPASRSDKVRLLEAADFRPDAPHTALRLQSLCVRWGCVEAEDVADEHGSIVPLARSRVGALGSIYNESLYDAIHDDDAVRIADYVLSGGTLTEAQRGK